MNPQQEQFNKNVSTHIDRWIVTELMNTQNFQIQKVISLSPFMTIIYYKPTMTIMIITITRTKIRKIIVLSELHF